MLSVYFVSVIICFSSSAWYVSHTRSPSPAISLTGHLSVHTFRCHSEKALKLGDKLDFQGLVMMIWGATVPLIYYAFTCNLDIQIGYWTLTSLAALFCTFFNFHSSFSKPHLQPARALSLGLLALSFFIPVVHSLAAYGLAVQTRRLALQWIVYTLICHTFCAATYATDVGTHLCEPWAEK